MTPKLSTLRLILREIKGNDLFGFYEILYDKETMNLLGGVIMTNDLDRKDFVSNMKVEREKGISYFWTITLKEEREFIGFIYLMSYNSRHYDSSFSSIGEYKYNKEFLKYFDTINGWEIEYALLKAQRNKGIMSEAVNAVLEFCKSENLCPIYAKVNSITNISTVKLLNKHNFQAHLPQIDPNLLKKYDEKTIIENKIFGMIYKWTI